MTHHHCDDHPCPEPGCWTHAQKAHDLDVKINHFEWPLTSKKDRWYRTVSIRWAQARRADRREVQVTISPKGGSVQVHVDGAPWGPVSHDVVQ